MGQIVFHKAVSPDERSDTVRVLPGKHRSAGEQEWDKVLDRIEARHQRKEGLVKHVEVDLRRTDCGVEHPVTEARPWQLACQ